VLKDRDYVTRREEPLLRRGERAAGDGVSGTLLRTLCRAMISRRGLRTSWTTISGGRAQWQAVLDALLARFQAASTAEVMEQKPSEDDGGARRVPRCPHAVPGQGRRHQTRASARMCGDRAAFALRGGRFGAFIACSNYPECKFTRKFGAAGRIGRGRGQRAGADRPAPRKRGRTITRKAGRFGPYIELAIGQGGEARLHPQGLCPTERARRSTGR
jgi:DNA topoisomerase-1